MKKTGLTAVALAVAFAAVSASQQGVRKTPLPSSVPSDVPEDDAPSIIVARGNDITIPMEGGGEIIILSPQFTARNQLNISDPVLSFGVHDQSRVRWSSLTIQFEIGGFCNAEVGRWSDSVTVTPAPGLRRHVIDLPYGTLQSCRAEVIKAHVKGAGPESLPISAEEIQAGKEARELREAESKVRAAELKLREEEIRRLMVEAQAKKDAAEEAQAVKERHRVREACAAIYRTTSNMKVSDLTVKQEQQVRACQALDLYPPG